MINYQSNDKKNDKYYTNDNSCVGSYSSLSCRFLMFLFQRWVMSCVQITTTNLVVMIIVVAATAAATNTSATCIDNENELRLAIRQAPKLTDTNITLCHGKPIVISSKWMKTKQMSGIDISSKHIHIACSSPSSGSTSTNKQNPSRCQLDGNIQSRIFYGISCRLYLYQVDIINSFPFSSSGISEDFYGGAIHVIGQSNLLIESSSFYSNNVQYYGGAIYLEQSNCTIKNNVTFQDNFGFMAGSIYAYQSTILASDGVYFIRNIASNKYGALLSNYSEITLRQVYFSGNRAGSYNGAAAFYDSAIQMDDVIFMNHTSSRSSGTVDLWYSNATLNRISFFGNRAVNNGASLFVINSKVLMTNTIHGYNTVPSARFGADLYISDAAIKTTSKSSFVDCSRNNTFCSGTNKTNIFDRNGDNNNNCRANGINGTTGKGLCRFPNF